MIPRRPNPGTDNAVMLDALIAAYPDTAWDLNHRLQITAHSRASELRKMGWQVVAARRTVEGRRKPSYGYRLETLPPNQPQRVA